MKKTLIKICAFLSLLIGVLVSLLLIAGAVLTFIFFPEGNLQKKVFFSGGLLIFAIVIGLIGVAVFESLLGLIKLEAEVIELEEEIEKREQKARRNGV